MKRILVVRTDRIGDVILTLPVVSALVKEFPDTRVDMLLGPSTPELVEAHPGVHEIVIDDERGDHSGFRGLLQLARHLRQRRYDLAVVVHPTFRLALLLLLTGIPRRIGSGYRWYQCLFTDKVYEHRRDAKRHEVEYNLNLVRSLGVRVDDVRFDFHIRPEDCERIETMLRSAEITSGDRLVILHPGSGGSARDWPASKFSELGDMLIRDVGVKVILTGSRDEAGLVVEVSQGMRNRPLLETCHLTLREMGALIRRAVLFVSNSTGPMHIAAAVGTPVVALFPPIIPCSPRRWGPYGALHTVIQPQVPACTRCTDERCDFYDCMELIGVDEVFEAAADRLREVKARPTFQEA